MGTRTASSRLVRVPPRSLAPALHVLRFADARLCCRFAVNGVGAHPQQGPPTRLQRPAGPSTHRALLVLPVPPPSPRQAAVGVRHTETTMPSCASGHTSGAPFVSPVSAAPAADVQAGGFSRRRPGAAPAEPAEVAACCAGGGTAAGGSWCASRQATSRPGPSLLRLSTRRELMEAVINAHLSKGGTTRTSSEQCRP